MNSSKKPIVFMFSGLGTQYYHMGYELYRTNPRFKLWLEHCDDFFHPLINRSLIDVIYDKSKKHEPFDELIFTSSALFSIQYALSKIVMEAGIEPDCLLGYSLGELVSAVVSGAISFEDGARVIVQFSQLVESRVQPGGMLGIVRSANVVRDKPELFVDSWLVAENCPMNCVVGGLSADLDLIQTELFKQDIPSQALPVEYAFHTPLLDSVKSDLKQFMATVSVYDAKIPIFSSHRQGMIDVIDKDYFWGIIREQIFFQKTIESISQNGDYIFLDLGPSGILATFLKYIIPNNSTSQVLESINQYGDNNKTLNRLIASVMSQS